MTSIPQILTLLVVFVGVPVVVFELIALVRVLIAKPRNTAARYSVVLVSFLVVLVIVFAIVFWNNDTVPPIFNVFQTMIATRLVVLAIAVIPGAYLLWQFRPMAEVDEVREATQDNADAEREIARDEADAAREVKRDEADAARDTLRGEANDIERHEIRDEARDEGRDEIRDPARDIARDKEIEDKQ